MEVNGTKVTKHGSGVQSARYETIANPGAGDCGVYAVMHTLWGRHDSDLDRAPIVRGQIAEVMKNFLSLYHYRERFEKKEGEFHIGEVVKGYKGIFSATEPGFTTFKQVAKQKILAPLKDEDKDRTHETENNLRGYASDLDSLSSWDDLEQTSELVRKIFDNCNLFEIDVSHAINDHNSTNHRVLDPDSCTPEEYAAYVKRDGVWLDNNELTAYLLTQGYIYSDSKHYKGGTVLEFINEDDRIIGLHNNARDTGGAASGVHWQAVSINQTLLHTEEEIITADILESHSAEQKLRSILADAETESIDLDKVINGLESEYSDVDLIGILRAQQEQEILLSLQEIKDKVHVILDDQVSISSGKIEQLKQIDQKYYGALIREYSYQKDQESLELLVDMFQDIGDLYKTIGDLSMEIYDGSTHLSPARYYTDAAIYYQYAMVTIQERLESSSTTEMIEVVYDKIVVLDQSILQFITGEAIIVDPKEVRGRITTNISRVKELRSDVVKDSVAQTDSLRLKIGKLDQQVQLIIDEFGLIRDPAMDGYVALSRAISEQNALTLRNLLSAIFKYCEEKIGTAPCKYAVICLGSLASDRASPYSDLEFAILTEDDDYRSPHKDLKVREYFKNITHLVNFEIINLGESIIPTSRYGIDLEGLVHKGIKLDMGGKTPLGRIEGEKPYDLVKTIEGMLWYVRNEQQKAEHIDKVLPFILTETEFIYGKRSLSNTYQKEVRALLDSVDPSDPQKLYRAVMSLKRMKEGVVEIDYSKTPEKTKHIAGDLELFEPLRQEMVGKLFDVKQEIYRLPDRLIYDLGLYYGIRAKSVWGIIEGLREKEIITTSAAVNLKYGAIFAIMLRFKTYLHNKGQNEDMSLFSKFALKDMELGDQAKVFHLDEEDLKEDGSLFKFFYTALTLHEGLEEFCAERKDFTSEPSISFFTNYSFYSDTSRNKGLIQYRLLQYRETLEHLEEAVIQEQNDAAKHDLKVILGKVYLETGERTKALECFIDILSFSQNPQYHAGFIPCLNAVAETYRLQSEYDTALTLQRYALCLGLEHRDDKSDLSISRLLLGLGNTNYHMHEYKNAAKYYSIGLKISMKLGHGSDDLSIANVLNNLAIIFQRQHSYDFSMNLHMETLHIREKIFKGEPHPDIADSLNNLGTLYKLLRYYKKAEDFYLKSLNIWQAIDNGSQRAEIAKLNSNLGNLYYHIRNYVKAQIHHEVALEICEKYFGYSSEEMGDCYYNLAAFDSRMGGEHSMAINRCEKSLKIREHLHCGKQHPDIAMCHRVMGDLLCRLEKCTEAIAEYNESLKIWEQIPNYHLYLEVVELHRVLGDIYGVGQNLQESFNHYNLALNFVKKKYDSINGFTAGKYNLLKKHAEIFHECSPFFRDLRSFDEIMQEREELWQEFYICHSLLMERSNVLHIAIARYILKIELPEDVEARELYLLGLLFLDDIEDKSLLINKLTSMGVLEQELELWLSIVRNDTINLRHLIMKYVDLDLNRVSFMRETPLIQAIINGYEEIVKALILGGADVNKLNADFVSPLHSALGVYGQEVNLSIAKLLLELRADPNQPMDDEDTPMHIAHYKCNRGAIELLLLYHASINIPNHQGKTPLHCLLEKKGIDKILKLKIIQEFKEKYDFTITDNQGQAPLDYARTYCPEAKALITEIMHYSTNLMPQQNSLTAECDLVYLTVLGDNTKFIC